MNLRCTLIIPVSKMAAINAVIWKIFDNPDVAEDQTFRPTHSADGLEPATHCVAVLMLNKREWNRAKTAFSKITGAYAIRDVRVEKTDYVRKSKNRIKQRIFEKLLKPIPGKEEAA